MSARPLIAAFLAFAVALPLPAAAFETQAREALVIDDNIALTATIDVLKAIASGNGPKERVLALGYAGWAAGQLDEEIQANGWLMVPADHDLVFGLDNESKWQRAIAKLGVDLSLLSSEAGHA